jgi:hypothetical protein
MESSFSLANAHDKSIGLRPVSGAYFRFHKPFYPQNKKGEQADEEIPCGTCAGRVHIVFVLDQLCSYSSRNYK